MPTLSIGSDNVVTLADPTTGDGLYDSVAQAYVNNASVTGELLDSTETLITGSQFTMSYVAASNGVYQGNLPNSITGLLTLGNEYLLQVTAVSGAYQLVIQLECTADYVGRLHGGCCGK